MIKTLIPFASGLIFALGLGLAGMLQPTRVMGFLDVFGTWDPTLAMVMGAALAVDLLAFALIFKRKRPVAAEQFHLPSQTRVDRPLVLGAVLFGAGWGLTGVCPGPALVALCSGQSEALVFAAAMAAGMGAFHATKALREGRQPAAVALASDGQAWAAAAIDG
jgi:uncharacterized membrane protein YedE/YeeE